MSDAVNESVSLASSGRWLRDMFLVGGLVCITLFGSAALAAWYLGVTGANGSIERDALKREVELFQEYLALRGSSGDSAEWSALERRCAEELPPLAKRLEPMASARRPATQKLYWVAKYRMTEMLQRCDSDPCPAAEECRRMIVESAILLGYDLPAEFNE